MDVDSGVEGLKKWCSAGEEDGFPAIVDPFLSQLPGSSLFASAPDGLIHLTLAGGLEYIGSLDVAGKLGEWTCRRGAILTVGGEGTRCGFSRGCVMSEKG